MATAEDTNAISVSYSSVLLDKLSNSIIEYRYRVTDCLKVEKLNGDSYHSWKFQMKMLLIAKDL